MVPNQVAVSEMGITACQSPTASANTGEAKILEARRGRPAVLHVTDDEHAGAHAQHMRESLAEPAFHTAGGDQHEFLGERIGSRHGQQPAEAVGEHIGTASTMQVKRHRSPDYDAASQLLRLATASLAS